MESTRRQYNFVPHEIFNWQDINVILKGVTNFVHVSEKSDEQWIVETTRKIGDWRSLIRTTYMRWRIAVDALERAAITCAQLPESECFVVTTLRPGDKTVEESVLGEWTGPEAAANHQQTAALLPAYGITDLLGAWEEIQFEMYRIFLNHHPQQLMKGENKDLRQLYYARHKGAGATELWQTSWQVRLESDS
jgi:hypothetical protein